ncbi:MAG: FAD/NAD(P)-binding:oxidoreductase [Lutibacter sp.]|uniref:ferric reductase-like transmembrane domain-containing protein n=1 Tax=Lutibacter sp. TaxID=1925666 RepID=UPI0017B5DF91|nr:ferric reductase-like transmembrane domain-containing protein [Lutibacter sp.]MBT8318199.1 ferric reductase-like transmembrane domain-containing protein [Lutibacter sp.]NNJ59059.1 FAD/NAD(P)-binding:oxidoreductase [Lutibacter sp.]
MLYYISEFPRRNSLKEILSITTIVGFTLLVSQFFSTRMNRKLVKDIRMVNVLKIHKIVGYVFISILLLHPFFIIVPKFFDNTVTPTDAFYRLITTFSSAGVILGLIAYTSMVILIITSFCRFKLNLSYRIWRSLHGYFTLLFIVTATWHVINIGRHSNTSFSIYYLLIVVSGIFYLLKTYFFKTSKNEKINK